MANKRKKTNQKKIGNRTKKPVNKTVKKKNSIKKPTAKKLSPKVVKRIPKIKEVKQEELTVEDLKKLIPASIEITEVEQKEAFKDEFNKEVDVIEVKEQEASKKKKKSIITRIFTPILLIPILLVIIAGIIAYLYIEESPKAEAKTYKEFIIGDKITLANDSIWYVIENSDNKKSSVSLLAEKPLDINEDKKHDSKDYMQFDKNNKPAYKEEDESNIGHYLISKYRFTLTNIIGVKKVRLLTSTEYVAIREALELDYEWTEENWLAGKSIGYWWLNANQNGKVYVVNNRGSYSLQTANKKYFVRPVIEISKGEVKLINEIKEENKGD